MPGGSLAQRNEHRMRDVAAGVTGMKLFAPPIEQAQTLGRVSHFVAQIVGPTAKGVDVVEVLVQFFRQKEADDVEILVVVCGEPPRVSFRLGEGPGSGESLRTGYKISWQ